MPPLVLALIDSVLALALHHDGRAKTNPGPGQRSASVRAELSGPEVEGPTPGGLLIRVLVTMVSDDGHSETQQVHVHIDLREQRMLARDLALAELPLDRSGLARLIGELESWCYRRIPPFELDMPYIDASDMEGG